MGGKLSDAVEYNGLVYLAGQVAEDLTADMKAQTEDVLRADRRAAREVRHRTSRAS